MNTTTERIDGQIKSLNELLQGIDRDKESIKVESENVIQSLDYRKEKVVEALTSLQEAFNRPINAPIDLSTGDDDEASQDHSSSGPREANPEPLMSISKERLERVQGFLVRQKEARQADIVAATKLNSGTVSVALRKLQVEGKAQMADHKERGSQVWIAA